ncbi:MAG: putative Multidrug resistance-associated protein 4, partial [Streblomastix strix]
VVLILFPIQGFLAAQMQKVMRSYLQLNDERNKITNEVLQGIRVVKQSGLESVFIERVEELIAYVYAIAVTVMVSQARFRDFLILPELNVTEQIPSKNESTAVEVIDGTFIWNDPPEIPMSKQEKLNQKKKHKEGNKTYPLEKIKLKNKIIRLLPKKSSSTREGDLKRPKLADIYFKLQKGVLTMVIGSIGSGKPSIGNITFGCEYDEDKYNEVIRVCALEPDFQTLAAGDMTAIGEKGVNLSGRQKAKIQLARAVYSDRDIYILDLPLSAVDVHIGRILFEECIEGRLKDKTRLLITNQLQYIDRSDNIILLDYGRITAQGTSQQLKEQGIDFQKFIIKESKNYNSDNSKEDIEKHKNKHNK